MKTSPRLYIFNLALTAALLGVLPGCASKTYQKADATALSLDASAGFVEQTRAQLSALSDSLALLKRDEDLAKHYGSFTTQVALFEKNAAKLSDNAQAMQSKGSAYFEQWEKDITKIENPSLRGSSSERLTQVSINFAAIKARHDETIRTFAPFLTDLKDIQTALGADLTPAGQASVQPFVERALVDIEPVKRSLENLAGEFSNLGVSLGATPATRR